MLFYILLYAYIPYVNRSIDQVLGSKVNIANCNICNLVRSIHPSMQTSSVLLPIYIDNLETQFTLISHVVHLVPNSRHLCKLFVVIVKF